MGEKLKTKPQLKLDLFLKISLGLVSRSKDIVLELNTRFHNFCFSGVVRGYCIFVVLWHVIVIHGH